MPKLQTLTAADFATKKIPGSAFGWSAIKTDHLGASKYTLVHLVYDNSGSVTVFAPQIRAAAEQSLLGMQRDKSTVNNVLIRQITFGLRIKEINPFNLAKLIDPKEIVNALTCDEDGTLAFDAIDHAIKVTHGEAKDLRDKEYGVNAVIIMMTDGCDNGSTLQSGKSARASLDLLRGAELVESIKTILVKVNVKDPYVSDALDRFAADVGFDQVEDVELIKDKHIARLAGLISKSVTSTAQSNGTGGPSKNVVMDPASEDEPSF